MKDKILALQTIAENFCSHDKAAVEEFRISMLGRKGALTLLFDEYKQTTDDKRQVGILLNNLKALITQKIEQCSRATTTNINKIADATRPANADACGSRHPISAMRAHIVNIFANVGFEVAEGPEIEDDYHVFGALNFAPDHPARDMQDTYFVDSSDANDNPVLLRTHTSSVQVRTMKTQEPPIRVICPGRVFRNEAISARAHCMFHQVEGLYVDKNVSFADLRQILLYFVHKMFSAKAQIRLRPSYFPFTEPSAELDVSCTLCGGKGCSVCKGTGWLEIAGCGMVHPNVLRNCGIDADKYSGYAFGMGIERMVMLKYMVRDLRLYFENDVRFLRQFAGIHAKA
jgi:phenylalanyl-tRNA synthetase alpha chain